MTKDELIKKLNESKARADKAAEENSRLCEKYVQALDDEYEVKQKLVKDYMFSKIGETKFTLKNHKYGQSLVSDPIDCCLDNNIFYHDSYDLLCEDNDAPNATILISRVNKGIHKIEIILTDENISQVVDKIKSFGSTIRIKKSTYQRYIDDMNKKIKSLNETKRLMEDHMEMMDNN